MVSHGMYKPDPHPTATNVNRKYLIGQLLKTAARIVLVAVFL
ncbi:MAG: hypothetical protein WCK59_01620 [Candidatus Falkowbacteria bacterium]